MTWLSQQIIYRLIILFAALTGSSKWKTLSKAFKILSSLLFTTFLFETTALICAYVLKNNTLVYNIFSPLQVLFFTYIFANLLKNKTSKNKIITAGILVAFFIVISSVFVYKGIMINTLSIIIKSTFYIILSLLKFREMLKDPGHENILLEPVFWLCTSVLLFFTVNILFWASLDYLVNTKSKIMNSFFDILYYSNLVFYLMLWYCFVIIKKNRRQYESANG
ncbi:MAG: hypothetical protein ACR2KX_17470 [Chitinophagaceae bacterium]